MATTEIVLELGAALNIFVNDLLHLIYDALL